MAAEGSRSVIDMAPVGEVAKVKVERQLAFSVGNGSARGTRTV